MKLFILFHAYVIPNIAIHIVINHPPPLKVISTKVRYKYSTNKILIILYIGAAFISKVIEYAQHAFRN